MDFFLKHLKKKNYQLIIENNKKELTKLFDEVIHNINRALNLDIREYIGDLSVKVKDLSKDNALGMFQPKRYGHKDSSILEEAIKNKAIKPEETKNMLYIDKSYFEKSKTDLEYKNIVLSNLSHELTHYLDITNDLTSEKITKILTWKSVEQYVYRKKEVNFDENFENFKSETLEYIKIYPLIEINYYMSDVELLARYIQSSVNVVNNIDTGRQLIPGSSFIKNNPQVIPYFKKQEEESKTQEKEELKKTDNKLEKTIDKPKLKKSPPKPKKIPKEDNKTKPKNYGSHIIQPYEILNQYEKKYGPIDSLSKLTWAIVRISKEKKLPHKEILEMVDNLNPYKPIDNKKSYNLKSFGIFKGSFQDVFNITAKWGVLNKNKNTIKQTFIKYSTQIEIKENQEQGLIAKWGASLSPSRTQRSLHRRFIGLKIGNPILGGKIPGEDFNCRCTLYFM